MSKKAVFLSASIPTKDRPPYYRYASRAKIREAVRSLVAVIAAQDRTLVFGGHPAISPLVEHTASTLDAVDHVVIFQSELFKDFIPEAAKRFDNLQWTKAGKSRVESLTAMRETMIASHEFAAGVFVGGMEGIFEEAAIFRTRCPAAGFFPLASTGGASLNVLHQYSISLDKNLCDVLHHDSDYELLLGRLLANLP